MKNFGNGKSGKRLKKNVNVIRHHHECVQTVTLTLEMTKRIFHDFPMTFFP